MIIIIKSIGEGVGVWLCLSARISLSDPHEAARRNLNGIRPITSKQSDANYVRPHPKPKGFCRHTVLWREGNEVILPLLQADLSYLIRRVQAPSL